MRSLATPFCRHTTGVSTVTNGARSSSAGAVSWLFIVRRTTSSSLQSTADGWASTRSGSVTVRSGDSTRRPRRRIVSPCSPRAISTTSLPCSESRPPRTPPLRPAPYTTNRMDDEPVTLMRMAATTLPSSWYGDASRHERERRRIFGREWLFFSFADHLRAPGDYVATDIAGWNLLVAVDDDGQLRGHHNVCRHRAGPLVEPGNGHVPSLVCRYHGWAYGLDGGLRSARDFGEFDCTEIALGPIRVATWRGLVFVNVDLV